MLVCWRAQAIALGQALVDGRWLDCVTHHDQLFRDEYALYRPLQVTVHFWYVNAAHTGKETNHQWCTPLLFFSSCYKTAQVWHITYQHWLIEWGPLITTEYIWCKVCKVKCADGDISVWSLEYRVLRNTFSRQRECQLPGGTFRAIMVQGHQVWWQWHGATRRRHRVHHA